MECALRKRSSETTYFRLRARGLFSVPSRPRPRLPGGPMFTLRHALATLAATLTCTAFAAQAADVFTAALDGSQQLPEPVKTSATGQLEFKPSADSKSIEYTLSVSKLGNASAGDVHLGPPSANGPLVLKLFPLAGASPKSGEFSGVLAHGTMTAQD